MAREHPPAHGPGPEPSSADPPPGTPLPPSPYIPSHMSRGDHVPPSRSDIRATIENYLSRHPEERPSLEDCWLSSTPPRSRPDAPRCPDT